MIGIDRIKRALQSGPRITPSDTDTWHGTPAPGSLWTYQQLSTFAAEGISPANVSTCTVGVLVQSARDWAMPPQTKRLLVPLIKKRRDGTRALIITPAGDKLWKDVL